MNVGGWLLNLAVIFSVIAFVTSVLGLLNVMVAAFKKSDLIKDYLIRDKILDKVFHITFALSFVFLLIGLILK